MIDALKHVKKLMTIAVNDATSIISHVQGFALTTNAVVSYARSHARVKLVSKSVTTAILHSMKSRCEERE